MRSPINAAGGCRGGASGGSGIDRVGRVLHQQMVVVQPGSADRHGAVERQETVDPVHLGADGGAVEPVAMSPRLPDKAY
jgi:hypothetical protein